MNILQAFSNAARAAIIAALVAGLLKLFLDYEPDSASGMGVLPNLLLGFFILLFNLKSGLDDYKHFGDRHWDRDPRRFAGLVLATVSWICFALSGFLLNMIDYSAFFAVLGFLISTAWLIAHLVEIVGRAGAEEYDAWKMRMRWLAINVAYIAVLCAFLGYFPIGALKHSVFVLVLLLPLFLVDFLYSKVFPIHV